MAKPPNGRPTRWGSEGATPTLPHLTTAITGPMTSEQVEAYAMLVRIEELHQKLLTDTVLPTNEFRRCPSPPPEYDAFGVRTNTRQRRYRIALEDEYHGLVHSAIRGLPNYRPPRGYVPRPAMRASNVTDKVYIPTKEYPWVNFIGQLLGPRGRSLADMNTQSGANIVIRGKGSVKEGRARRPNHHRVTKAGIVDDSHEPLHCLITADTRDKVDRAKKLVQDAVEAATMPEHTNARKKQQLRDLAKANGTFRDDEGQGHAGRLLTLPTDNTATNANSAPTSTVPPWRRAAVGSARAQESRQSNTFDIEYRHFEAELDKLLSSF
ncbi:branchpoint-bridging protein [Apiospora marii]|uniref:Branchpoint-bridging protein n=1 Tax=Apiospora marii TaxID=335849 RepID=A0ABR1S0S4_9PEZI